MQRLLKNVYIIFLASVLSGCGKDFSGPPAQSETPLSNDQASNEEPSGEDPINLPGDNQPGKGEKNTCGQLSFDGIKFPISLTSDDRMAMRLAMNITGSFEGHQGWTNLSNNFDGQGFSLGLLQQNLGQGSLQTLLIEMRNRHLPLLVSSLGKSNTDSILSMVAAWQGHANLSKFSEDELDEELLFSNEKVLSPLDIGFTNEGNQSDIFAFKNSASNTKNAQSVDWALTNVFVDDGSTFKAAWKSGLQKMAGSAEYRSLQIESSMKIYQKAVGYVVFFGFRELRSFLLMYDFVTQNGGFNSKHQREYASFESKSPNASEKEKLKALLEIRLKSVIPQYVSDVRSRKSTIIEGTGKVHGQNRNLTKEYCYQASQSFSSMQTL
ncbi:MAG: hypothetical protein ACK5WZ_13685 [Pseudobdellovibrionaceae bacterium]|jgi:hypothetical protein